MTQCLNCQNEISPDHKFCQQCGQKTKLSELRFFVILKDFFKNLFNLESKIWNTFKDIWIPGKLATAFVEGKRKRYYHPLRFFLVVLFAFFTVLVMQTREGISQVDEVKEREQQNIWNEDMNLNFDSLVRVQNIEFDSLLPFRAKLFKLNKKDSLSLTNILDTTDIQILEDENVLVMDSTKKRIDRFNFEMSGLDQDSVQDHTNSKNNLFGMSIDQVDFYKLSPEKLVKKYSSGKWWEKKLLTQTQKMMNNLSSSVSFFISNGTWMIVVTILLMALLFKLLYFRHNFFYVEHFIFHTYGHTRVLLIGLVLELGSKIVSFGGAGQSLAVLVAAVYLFLGMKKYYKQSFLKTMFKFIIVSISYVFIISACMILVLFISFAVL